MKISAYLSVGLTVSALVVGLSIGYGLSPEYKMGMYEKTGMGLGVADRTFDLRYLNAMIAHHRGAMILAEQIKEKTQRAEIKDLAEKILADEPAAIEELYTWKKDWFGDDRKVQDPIVSNLGPADEKVDLRFLNALIFHHEEGVLMTKETRVKSSRAEILNNADAVEIFLKNGIESLSELRKNWYNI